MTTNKNISDNANEKKRSTQRELDYREALEVYFPRSIGTNIDKLNNFAKYVPRQILTRFISRYELFRKVINIQGSIIECGVFLGGGLMTFAQLSATLEPVNWQRQIIGFDTFGGFPSLSEIDTRTSASEHSHIGGMAADSYDDLLQSISLFDQNRFLGHLPKITLVKGDACETIPEYVERNPHLVCSLLYLDFDIYEPTRVAIENFLPRMPKGAILAFDQLNMPNWPGETQAVMATIGINNLHIQRFEFDSFISYAIIEEKMKTIFRADGSRDIGLGHIMRCLTLADGLKYKRPDADIMFISKYEDGRGILKSRGYKVVDTEADEVLQIKRLADRETLLITDFLDTDNAYISRIKGTTDIRVIAIDNNTRLKVIDADVVVNANVFDEGETKLIGSTRYFLGPRYVILRRDFDTAHKEGKKLRDKVRKILVLSGGGDFAGGKLILNSIKALEKIDEGIHINVIVGPTFPYRDELNKLLSKTTRPFDVSFAPSNLIELMKKADMAITAAGTVLYELASLGVPSIAVPIVTPNTSHQEDIANNFEKHGACINLGRSPSNEVLREKTLMLMQDKLLRKQLSDNGKALVDGKGLQRALEIILGGHSDS